MTNLGWVWNGNLGDELEWLWDGAYSFVLTGQIAPAERGTVRAGMGRSCRSCLVTVNQNPQTLWKWKPSVTRLPEYSSIFHVERCILSIYCRPAQPSSLKIICLKLVLGSVCAEGTLSTCLVFRAITTSLKKNSYKWSLKNLFNIK